jgi:PHP family Zn ribbon phosphoesterase
MDALVEDIAKQIEAILERDPHALAYQKWTCPRCQQRLTMEEPNTLYTSGRCDECGLVSPIFECGFMLVMGKALRQPKEKGGEK